MSAGIFSGWDAAVKIGEPLGLGDDAVAQLGRGEDFHLRAVREHPGGDPVEVADLEAQDDALGGGGLGEAALRPVAAHAIRRARVRRSATSTPHSSSVHEAMCSAREKVS